MSDVKLNIIAYKGKHYTYQDVDIEPNEMYEYVIGTTTKQEILKDLEEIEEHIENCNYYGIAPYHGDDDELNQIFNVSSDE